MNLPTLPKTSLIVLHTLCPCRRTDNSCCYGTGQGTRCCDCHMLAKDQERGSPSTTSGMPCDWYIHTVIDGHQAWETEAIRLMRDYDAAVAVLHSIDLAKLSEEEHDRLIAARNAMAAFLSDEEATDGK